MHRAAVEMLRQECENCKDYSNGYCKHRKVRVNASDVCKYHEYPFFVELPDGQRVWAVSAKKHLTVFSKSKRGPTDPKLKELRKRLDLPKGYRLQKSRSSARRLAGSVYIKDAKTNKIVRTISAEEVMRILNK